MTDVRLIKQPHGLTPADTEAKEVLGKIKLGSIVKCKITRPRNPQHHRKAFALFQMLHQNLDHNYQSFEDFYQALKYALGWYRVIETKAGPLPVVDSLAFDAMDQTEFERRYDQMIGFVTDRIWPSLRGEEVRQMVNEFLESELV